MIHNEFDYFVQEESQECVIRLMAAVINERVSYILSLEMDNYDQDGSLQSSTYRTIMVI